MLTFLNMPLWVFLLLLTGAGCLLLAGAVQSRLKRVRSVSRGLMISYVMVLLVLAGAETYFRFLYADSGWGFTLAHQNWEDRYWQTNERGFRDVAWQPDDFDDKTTVAVLGDSFASGWGVNDPQNRFSNVLAQHLGAEYAVINLAVPGTSTPQQLELLQQNPPDSPDVVLLQYFLNDIELASASVSRLWETDFVTAPAHHSIATDSYFGNYLYWLLYPLLHPVNATFEGSYWEWQYETYDNYAIWQIHEEQLHAFVDYVESIDAELYVVLFPNMEDPVGSIPYIDRVKFVFEERGYSDNVMTLYDEVAAWDSASAPLVASPRDAHPSAAFHRYVGDLLYDRFFADK